jgi:hypothetical protein
MGIKRPYIVRLAEGDFWSIAIVFVTSVFITLCFLWILPTEFQDNESSDYLSFYEPVARNLLDGHGLRNDDGTFAIRYPPGYPIILAGLFGLSSAINVGEKTVLSIFTVFCMGLASAFVFLLARNVWGSQTAFIAAGAWMTYPFALWLTKQPNSELPFITVLFGSLYILSLALACKIHNRIIYFICGSLIGIATLIRPIAIGLPIIICVFIWTGARYLAKRHRVYLLTFILIGALIPIVIWETWTYSQTGKVLFVSSGESPSIRDGLTFAVNSKDYRQGVKVPEDVRALMLRIHAKRDSLRSPRSLLMEVAEEFRVRPLTVLQLFVIKAGRSWYGTDSQRYENAILLIQIPYLIWLLWATRVSWVQGGRSRQVVVGVWLIILYFWGMTILVLPILRYLVPAMGVAFVLLPATLKMHSKRISSPVPTRTV